MGIQLQNVQIGHLYIARRLRDKQARGEPITIKNFVIDTIIKVIDISMETIYHKIGNR